MYHIISSACFRFSLSSLCQLSPHLRSPRWWLSAFLCLWVGCFWSVVKENGTSGFFILFPVIWKAGSRWVRPEEWESVGFGPAPCAVGLLGWLWYGPSFCVMVLLRPLPPLEGLKTHVLEFSAHGLKSWLGLILVWDLSQLFVSKPEFSHPGTVSLL